MSLPWQLAAVPFLIALNAFFVAAEYAVVALRPGQIDTMRKRGRVRSAAAMSRLKESPASSIGAIQVCITLTNLLLGWIGEPAMSAVLRAVFSFLVELLPPTVFLAVSTALSFLLVTLLTVVFSELLPKAMTLRYTSMVAWITAIPILQIRLAVQPLVWLMNQMASLITRPLGLGSVEQVHREHHTVDEIRLIAAESADAGTLTPRERSLILNSLALGRKTAEQIMVPRVRATYLDLQFSMQENLRRMNERLFSRLPLCDGGMDRVVGLVYTKEFLTAYQAESDTDATVLSLIARPAVFAPVTLPLDRLLGVIHEQRSHLVFLVDEYGGIEGIVTLTDVVDELLGEMSESPQAVDVKVEDPGGQNGAAGARRWIVPGELPLHQLARQLGREDWGSAEQVNTVAGLIVTKAGAVPPTGRIVELDGVKLRVIASDRRSVQQVEVLVPAVRGGETPS